MRKIWYDKAWDDYLYWQTQDKKTLKRINKLIRDIERGDNKGIGKPEILSGDLAGFCNKAIDDSNRVVYRIKDGRLEIAQCKGHYNDR